MKLTPLEIAHLELLRDVRSADLVQTHTYVHDLVLSHQNDASKVDEGIAKELIFQTRAFAHSTVSEGSIFAFSLVEKDLIGADLVYLDIALTPDEEGLYEVTSASDKFEGFFEV